MRKTLCAIVLSAVAMLSGCMFTFVPTVSIQSFELSGETSNPIVLNLGDKFILSGLAADCIATINKDGEELPLLVKYDISGTVVSDPGNDKLLKNIYQQIPEVEITAASSDASVLAVKDNSEVVTVAPGMAEVYITLQYMKTDDASEIITIAVPFVVTVPLEGLIASVSATVFVGENAMLDAEVLPFDASDNIMEYSISDSAVATVDESGLVTAQTVGKAVVTITARDEITGESFTGQTEIEVKIPPIESVSAEAAVTIIESETVEIDISILPQIADNYTLSFASSNEAIATVDERGVVVGVSVGEAAITATVSDKNYDDRTFEATTNLTVKAPPITAVTAGESMSLRVGRSEKIAITISPENAAEPAITYFSSDEAVAKVDEHGNVQAIAMGEAVITAQISDEENEKTFTIETKVKVNEASSSSSGGSSNSRSLKKGMTDAEYDEAYKIAAVIAAKYSGMSRAEQLKGIYRDLRKMTDTVMDYSTTAKHYNDIYGFYVLNTASCAGATRAVGICLNILGIPYEHVNENKWLHQWCRVNVDGVYWICDAYGAYVGQEPGPYLHPVF